MDSLLFCCCFGEGGRSEGRKEKEGVGIHCPLIDEAEAEAKFTTFLQFECATQTCIAGQTKKNHFISLHQHVHM